MTARSLRWARRVAHGGVVACAVWLVAAVVHALTAEPALADNCGSFNDCFGQTGSAAEAAFGLTLLAGLSLVLDFTPIVGDVKGVIEAVTGEDLLTGQELEPWERALGLIPLLPIGDVARAATKIDDIADLGRHVDDVADVGRHVDDVGDAGRHADDVAPPPPPPRDGDGGGGGRPPDDDGPPRAPDDEPPPRAPQGDGPVVRATDGGTLRPAEIDSAHRYEELHPGERLYDYKSRTGLDDYDYYDSHGRAHDQVGDPNASRHWNAAQFNRSLDLHVYKIEALPPAERGSVIVDLTGFTDSQKLEVGSYIDSLPAARQALFVRIGF